MDSNQPFDTTPPVEPLAPMVPPEAPKKNNKTIWIIVVVVVVVLCCCCVVAAGLYSQSGTIMNLINSNLQPVP
jgi:flagellar basal body-associated protein FliL